MSAFDRIGRGWRLGMDSLQVVKDHPQLLALPALSGAAFVVLLLSLGGGLLALVGLNPQGVERFMDQMQDTSLLPVYVVLFLFYLVGFFITIFFNVALIHCVRQVFAGREPVIVEGLRFAASRMGSILAWAGLAATVGVILKAIEQRAGWLGKVLSGLLGMAWAAASYFVLPVLAYEDVKPVEALRRSSQVIVQKWGESLGAGFSFFLFYLVALVGAVVVAVLLAQLNVVWGILTGVGLMVLASLGIETAKTIFLAAAYEQVTGAPTPAYYDHDTLDAVFVRK